MPGRTNNGTVIVWDWDNTLVDTAPAIFAAQRETFVHYGKPVPTDEECHNMMAHSAKGQFLQMFGEDKAGEVRDYYVKSYDRHAADIKPFAGAGELLGWAGDRGFISVIASNKGGSLLRKEVGILGFSAYFDRILGAGDAPKDKPDRAIFDMATQGLKFSKAMVIGDGPGDVRLANNAGVFCVLVNEMAPDAKTYEGLRIDRHFRNLMETREFLSAFDAS